MIRLPSLVAAVLAVPLLSAPAFAADYAIDTTHSQVGFRVKHMMVANVRGRFKAFDAKLSYDPKNVAATTIEATVQTASIDTDTQKRDDHLRSPDFFDAAKFPELTFKSKKVTGKDGKLFVTGDLTLHGVTKEVVLEVEGPTPEYKDPYGNTKIGATATTRINREDFGLKWNVALETGGVLVGKEVDITLELEFTQVPAPAKK